MDVNTGRTLYAFLIAILFLDLYSLLFQRPFTASFYIALWVLIFALAGIAILAIRLRHSKRSPASA